jgi:hypothetical protein
MTLPMVAVIGALAIAACAISLHVTAHVPFVLPDSASYMSAAHNLVSGKGLTTSFNPATSLYHPAQAAAVYGRVPLAQYGPLYPVVLVLAHYLGFSANDSVRVVGLVTLIAFIALVGMLAARLTDRRPSLMAVLVVVCVAAPGLTAYGLWLNPLALSTFALSDLLFYVLVLASLLAMDSWLRHPTVGRWALLVVLIVASVLTRYAAVSIAATAACAVLAEASWDRRRRVLGAVSMIGIGLAAFVGWDLLNKIVSGAASPRSIVFHPTGHLAYAMLQVASAWFFPSSWPEALTGLVTVVIMVATVVIALSGRARRWVVGELPVAVSAPLRLWRIGGWFVVCYTAMIVITSTWLDASLAIDNRMLGPIQTVLYLLIASMLYWTVRSRVRAPQPQLWAIGAVAVAAIVLWAPNAAALGSELTVSAPTTPAQAAISAIPASQFVVTNDTAGLYLYDGHASMLVPFHVFYTTGRPNPDFTADLRETGRLVRQRRGVVVWWPELSPGLPSVRELEQVGHLVIKKDLPGGTLILAAADN